MTEIKWQEPPADGRLSRDLWEPIASALRDRPGAWALVAECTPISTAANITGGRLKAFRPANAFQAISRNRRVIDGQPRVDVYARFVAKDVAR